MDVDVELLEDAAVLRDFLSTQYFAVLDKLWSRSMVAVQEGVFTRPVTEFEYHKGRYVGMQELVNLPSQIIEMANHTLRRSPVHASQV